MNTASMLRLPSVALSVLIATTAGCKKTAQSNTSSQGGEGAAGSAQHRSYQSTAWSSTLPSVRSDWPAFHGGGPLRGDGAPIGAPPMKVRWTFRAGEDESATSQPSTRASNGPAHFEGSPAIADGVVYMGDTAGTLYAIDIKTGRPKWAYHAEDGFATTPLVLNGKVLTGDLSGIFHAVSVIDGHKLWTFDANGSPIHSSANAEGIRIVFGTDGADIFCLDADTGKQLWTQKAGDRINGAPAISRGAALVSGCDAHLRAMKLSDGSEEYDVDLGALCPGSAAVLSDRLVLGTDQGRVLCLSADQRQQLWVFDKVQSQAMVYSSPAVADGVVVVGARDRNIYGIDLATGKKLWNYATRGDVDSSPAISSGRVYIGSKDKKLYVLDLKTGKELWQFSASRGITASPAIGEGVVVIGDSGGMLYCLEPGK